MIEFLSILGDPSHAVVYLCIDTIMNTPRFLYKFARQALYESEPVLYSPGAGRLTATPNKIFVERYRYYSGANRLGLCGIRPQQENE
jgi:hypothetical protein